MIQRFLALALLGGVVAAQNPNKGAWYENAVIYQIYPRSFQDTGIGMNGTGDLRGILRHVDYLEELGIDAVWLNPIYPSPMKDFGYDISDFTAIDPIYGTMADFEELLGALKNRSIKLIMDFVPNHTSDQHEWFKKSVQKDQWYKDYYVWYTPSNVSDPTPPNNWTSNFNGSMWEFHPVRKEYYLHQFLKEQPDLNYRNARVVEDMNKVLTFWMDKGVQGFRMDAVFAMVENQGLYNEPYIGGPTFSYNSYNHTMTAEQPETFEKLRQFRETLDSYAYRHDNISKIMMTESYNMEWSDIKKYYGSPRQPISTFPFNFFWITQGKLGSTAADWADLINNWYNVAMPSGDWAQANFVLGNHDQNRFASRLTPQHTDIMNMLQLTLKGTAVVYYGDEIGLQDSWVRRDQGQDPVGKDAAKGDFMAQSRDPERAPMPWDNTTNGGFTNSTPWLPLAADYWETNVAAERDNNTSSHLRVFKRLVKLRKTSNMGMRSCEVEAIGGALVVYRNLTDHPTIITVINLSNVQERVNLKKNRATLPSKLLIEVKSVNYEWIEQSLNRTTTEVDAHNIELPPLTGLVLTTY